MFNYFKKLFCKHDWFTHNKKEYTWKKTKPINGTKHWYKPMLETNQYSETTEILICKKCGEINKIKY